MYSYQCLALTCSLHSDPWQRGCGQEHTCAPGRECVATSKVFYQSGENVAVGWTSVAAAGDSDLITIDSTDGTVPCSLSRFTDGRITLSATERSHSERTGTVIFDAATSPLRAGEYIVRLHAGITAANPAGRIQASSYFVVMESMVNADFCENSCDPAVPCMPFWGATGLEYTCGVCPTGFDSSLCTGHVCPECTGCPSDDGLTFFDGEACTRLDQYFDTRNTIAGQVRTQRSHHSSISRTISLTYCLFYQRLCGAPDFVQESLPGTTLQECARRCETDSFCDGVNYIWERRECQLLATTSATLSDGGHSEQQHTSSGCATPGTFEYFTKSNECASNPCKNGGACTPATRGYACGCYPGWGGNNCEADVNECLDNNGGCADTRACLNTNGTSSCGPCAVGYEPSGDTACRDIDECSGTACFDYPVFADINGNTCADYSDLPNALALQLMPCTAATAMANVGTSRSADRDCCICGGGHAPCSGRNGEGATSSDCQNTPGSFSCGTCPAGFTDAGLGGAGGCHDINECLINPSVCPLHTNCLNTDGDYECSACAPGYLSDGLETRAGAGYHFAPGAVCIDPDDCLTTPCFHQGVCTDIIGGVSCACSAGFAGPRCELNVDNCLLSDGTNPCQNRTTGAICYDGVDSFMCNCPDGYSGAACTGEVDACTTSENVCSQFARCDHLSSGQVNCTCHIGYVGDGNQCAEVMECDSTPCQNSGE